MYNIIVIFFVAGCGYNINNSSCFFTKNGKYIGIASKNMSRDVRWFPTIGMNSMGEKVEMNFGSKPFVYNIELESILQKAHQKDLMFQGPVGKGQKRVNEENLD